MKTSMENVFSRSFKYTLSLWEIWLELTIGDRMRARIKRVKFIPFKENVKFGHFTLFVRCDGKNKFCRKASCTCSKLIIIASLTFS